MKVTLHATAIIAVLSLSAIAQPMPQPAPADRDLKIRIDSLEKQLQGSSRRDLSDDQWDEQLRDAATAIRADVISFIETQVGLTDDAPAIEGRLRAALKDQERIDGDSDEATARVAPLRNGRSLVIAYTIPRPLHEDTAEVYGFRADGGRYRLAARTGLTDFDHYSLSTRQVPSPFPGVMYILAFGQAVMANGAFIKFRLYAFDGATFMTLWEPKDLEGAKVSVTPRGFDITHIDRTLAGYVTDRYETTLNGVVKIE
jgi:hypothetical protein